MCNSVAFFKYGILYCSISEWRFVNAAVHLLFSCAWVATIYASPLSGDHCYQFANTSNPISPSGTNLAPICSGANEPLIYFHYSSLKWHGLVHRYSAVLHLDLIRMRGDLLVVREPTFQLAGVRCVWYMEVCGLEWGWDWAVVGVVGANKNKTLRLYCIDHSRRPISVQVVQNPYQAAL